MPALRRLAIMHHGTYTVFDHTADIGVEVSAPTAEALLETAAEALFDQIVDRTTVVARAARAVSVAGADLEEVLVRWLAELLFLEDAEGLLLSRFRVEEVSQRGLTGEAWGEPYDPERHAIKTQIKAVTYHQVRVWKEDVRWRARIIFDV